MLVSVRLFYGPDSLLPEGSCGREFFGHTVGVRVSRFPMFPGTGFHQDGRGRIPLSLTHSFNKVEEGKVEGHTRGSGSDVTSGTSEVRGEEPLQLSPVRQCLGLP